MRPVIAVMPLVDDERESLWMLPGYMDALREAVWRNLDAGMLLGLDMTLEHLREQGQPQAVDSIRAREWLLAKGTNA